jgi:alpha,alpha-trehalase
VERKKFSIAVHYRMVEDSETAEVERIVDEVLSGFSSLVKGTGKKVFELKPDIEWDKGKALLWVMKALGLDFDNSLTMYIGDDTTDEDAFRELKNKGTGIIVRDGDKNRKTFAGYYLNNTSEVQAFLMKLAELS